MVKLNKLVLPGNTAFKVYSQVEPGGSILFDGSSTTLQVGAAADWAPGLGDFTVEWFQYMTTPGAFPRVFSVGAYPTASLAVSIEGGTFYGWLNSSPVLISSLSGYLNTWVHFAMARESGTTTVYQDGSVLATTNTVADINNVVDDLFIGSEAAVVATFFDGNITNFRWTTGLARYTAAFAAPVAPLAIEDAFTKLLLRATDVATVLDDETGAHSVTDVNNSAVWSALTPF